MTIEERAEEWARDTMGKDYNLPDFADMKRAIMMDFMKGAQSERQRIIDKCEEFLETAPVDKWTAGDLLDFIKTL